MFHRQIDTQYFRPQNFAGLREMRELWNVLFLKNAMLKVPMSHLALYPYYFRGELKWALERAARSTIQAVSL